MEVWLELIEAVADGDCAKVVQLCQAHPCLTTRQDAAGNSLLHYVVVQRDPQFINKFLDAVEVDKTLKNHQGATPYDLWYEYEQSTLCLGGEFQNGVGLLAESVAEGNLKLIDEGLKLGISPRLYNFDDESLVTLLHLGALYGQPESIRAVLEHVDDALFSKLLTIQDSEGRTPLKLAEEESQDGDPEGIEVLQLLRERQRTMEASRGVRTTILSPPAKRSEVMPWHYHEQIIELNKKLAAGVTEADFPLIRSALPALCALSSAVCRLALQQPYSEKQALFFEQMSGAETSQLQGNIRIIAERLEECVQKDRVHALFELTADPSVVKPSKIGVSHPGREKIYFNPITDNNSKINLLTAVELFIHEKSHTARHVLSVDFCRKGWYWKTGEECTNECKIMLNNCFRLAKEGKYAPTKSLKKNRIELIKLAGRLWPYSRPLPSLLRGCHLAARNANTIAVTVLGLAAMALDQAETCTEVEVVANVNEEEARKEHYLLKISANFLSENGIREMLEMYGTAVHRAETPPPLTVFSSGTSPTKEQSLHSATAPKLTQAMASISDTQSSSKISSNADRSTSELLNGIVVANNRPN